MEFYMLDRYNISKGLSALLKGQSHINHHFVLSQDSCLGSCGPS